MGISQDDLKAKLKRDQKRRAEMFASYGLHHARRLLAGQCGGWFTKSNRQPVYFTDKWPRGWRDLGDVHDICRKSDKISSRLIEHTGWYADSYRDSLIIGRVLQLPARNGSPRYVPATYCTEGYGVALYLDDICDNLCDAVLRADRCAEIEAEAAREDNAQQLAEQQIDELREEIKTARRECLALLREMRSHRDGITGNAPHVCATLRAHVAQVKRQIGEARERIAALTENFWLAVGE